MSHLIFRLYPKIGLQNDESFCKQVSRTILQDWLYQPIIYGSSAVPEPTFRLSGIRLRVGRTPSEKFTKLMLLALPSEPTLRTLAPLPPKGRKATWSSKCCLYINNNHNYCYHILLLNKPHRYL